MGSNNKTERPESEFRNSQTYENNLEEVNQLLSKLEKSENVSEKTVESFVRRFVDLEKGEDIEDNKDSIDINIDTLNESFRELEDRNLSDKHLIIELVLLSKAYQLLQQTSDSKNIQTEVKRKRRKVNFQIEKKINNLTNRDNNAFIIENNENDEENKGEEREDSLQEKWKKYFETKKQLVEEKEKIYKFIDFFNSEEIYEFFDSQQDSLNDQDIAGMIGDERVVNKLNKIKSFLDEQHKIYVRNKISGRFIKGFDSGVFSEYKPKKQAKDVSLRKFKDFLNKSLDANIKFTEKFEEENSNVRDKVVDQAIDFIVSQNN